MLFSPLTLFYGQMQMRLPNNYSMPTSTNIAAMTESEQMSFLVDSGLVTQQEMDNLITAYAQYSNQAATCSSAADSDACAHIVSCMWNATHATPCLPTQSDPMPAAMTDFQNRMKNAMSGMEIVWDYDWSCEKLEQSQVDTVIEQMTEDVQENGAASSHSAYIDPGFKTERQTKLSRSMYRMRRCDINAFMTEDIFKAFDPPLEYAFAKSPFMGEQDRFIGYQSLRVRIYYDGSFGIELNRVIQTDFLFAGGSVVVVYFIIWAYTGSFFLANLGMFQILVSLFLAALVYRQVFAVRYFEFLHILIVYLVLGIGADDIFVLVDSFKHNADELWAVRPIGEKESRAELHAVMKSTYKRTAAAIFNTSFTTAVAFLSTSGSKVMPMRTCSWFAAVCIVLNYVLTITFFPAVLVNWHIYFRKKSCRAVLTCCCPEAAAEAEHEDHRPEPTAAEIQARRRRASASRVSVTEVRPENQVNPNPPKAASGVLTNGDVTPQTGCTQRGVVETVLIEYYVPLLKWKIGSIKIVAWFLVLAMIGCAAQGAFFRFAADTAPIC
jgi:hypothetical protein